MMALPVSLPLATNVGTVRTIFPLLETVPVAALVNEGYPAEDPKVSPAPTLMVPSLMTETDPRR